MDADLICGQFSRPNVECGDRRRIPRRVPRLAAL